MVDVKYVLRSVKGCVWVYVDAGSVENALSFLKKEKFGERGSVLFDFGTDGRRTWLMLSMC